MTRGRHGGIQSEAVRIRLLGGFGVSVGPRTIGEGGWRLKKAGDLVKLLALARGHRLHRDQMAAALWPDLGAKHAANNLHRALHSARKILEPAAGKTASRHLTLRAGMLELCPEGPLWVDVEAFEEAAAAARRGREPAAYRAAIELYAGELLPGDRYEAWTEEKRDGLRLLHRELLMEQARLHEERGEYGLAVEILERAVSAEPAREEAYSALMRLHLLQDRRHEALRQYERLRKILSAEYGAEPGPAVQRLYQEIMAGEDPAVVPPTAGDGRPRSPASLPPGNLPAPLTSFVGRERAMVEVKRLLSMTRLLTLSGAGGSGKTRLALEVARDLAKVHPDGAWLVELAPLSDPALAPRAVAAALDVREQPDRSIAQRLSDYLRARNLLLVLDNCEHLVDAAARLVEDLLGACPGLRVLATSREPLGVPGEVVYSVSPLSLPDRDTSSTVEGLMRCEAVRLYVDRARSRLPDFGLTPETAHAVERICRRLDGVPLAIELAAARSGALAVDRIAERLEDSLGLLTGGGRTSQPRQRTMRAALDWSYDLLGEAERRLFAGLSVFVGGWTLEAAEEVFSRTAEVADLLSSLVEKSLVVAERVAGAEGVRYRMLEPIRQYAWEKLEEDGERADRIRERHAEYYLAFAETAEPELMGAEPMPWLAALGREVDNLRAALSWALDEGSGEERVETGLRLANALARFWDMHGPGEGRRWLEKGLDRGVEVPPPVRAEALREAGFVAVYEWDPRSIQMLTEALELYEEIGDQTGMLATIDNLGHALAHHADPGTTAPIKAKVEALLAGSGDRNVEAHLAHFLGFAAAAEKDFEEMISRLKEALALFRELGDTRNITLCLPSLGFVTLVHHDFEGAARLFEEGLAMERRIKYKTVIFFHLMGLAAVAVHRGHLRRAAKLYGASETLRETSGFSLAAVASSEYDYEGYLAVVRAGLDDEAVEAAWGEGRALSLDEAVEYALGPEDASAASDARYRAQNLDPLTRREREVAALIGQGLTNRQIGEELKITERTVETHVSKILRKLGLRSRTGIATWVVRES